VKLTDFGVAYRAGDTRLTRIGYAVGTPGYIAPEILDGAEPTALTDIYAVGATAQALLSYQPYEPPARLREFVDRATSPNPAHRPQSAWAALKLLTGRKAPSGSVPAAGRKVPAEIPERLPDQALRLLNGAAAGWLGYLLGSQLLVNGAEALGIAAGLGVAGYLLPRLAAIGVVVALAVVLVQSGVGLGFAVLVPLVGGIWVAGASAAGGGMSRLPLGPVLSVPLTLVGLGAGLPLLFGALMRPVGACLSAAAGALTLICYDLTIPDGTFPDGQPFSALPYSGAQLITVPTNLNIEQLLQWAQAYLQVFPKLPLMIVLWAAMALVVSLAELAGRWVAGLLVAVGGGILGYVLIASAKHPEATPEAVISLSLAAIMYAVLRYLVARVRG
jgi:hypothetical protein